MKIAKLAVSVLVLFLLGYALGPTLGPMLVKDASPPPIKTVQVVEVQGIIYKIDLDEYPDNELPPKIKVVNPFTLPLKSGEGLKSLPFGAELRLMGREKEMLRVETIDGIAEGEAAVEKTNLFQLVAEEKYEKDTGTAIARNEPEPKPEKEATKTPDQPAEDPPGIVANDRGDGDEMTGEPEPAPEDSTPAGPRKLSEEEILALMKAHIDEGKLEDIKPDKVKASEVGPDENIDGINYQIGIVTYEAKTLFGVQPVNAKALIRDGEIDRWISAKTGMELR